MTEQNFAYLFAELAMLTAAVAVGYSTRSLGTFRTKRFLSIAVLLYFLWLGLDLLAVKRGVFYFPEAGNLPLRIYGLPLEEHLFFPVHAAVVWGLVLLTENLPEHVGEDV